MVSERVIENAIDALEQSPGKFQHLIECYAEIAFPERFNRVVPRGRNTRGTAVKGWPDVYGIDRAGRMDVLEITRDARWGKHLQSDLAKAEALGAGRLSGFLFVAWADGAKPGTGGKDGHIEKLNLLSEARRRLCALDIPLEKIRFIFKKELLKTLTRPRFARLLAEFLDIPNDCLPFRQIDQAGLFSSGKMHEFKPTRQEYLDGRVHCPALLDKVEARLAQTGWAWVRGRGASGKTVLAVSLGMKWQANRHPVHYFNLTEENVRAGDVVKVITNHADDGVLFILNSVHLDERFARDVFNYWRSASMGSRLLLLGRDTALPNYSGVASPLDDLRAESMLLRVTPSDLVGVYHRLAFRYKKRRGPEPPAAVVAGWHNLFGCALIAFSAAVVRHMDRLFRKQWALAAQDARDYVYHEYMAGFYQDQLLDLLTIAVLGQLEVAAPANAVDGVHVDGFLKNGLLHHTRFGGFGQYETYRLVHPGLADLLLEAAKLKCTDQFRRERFLHVGRREPYTGGLLAARLELADRLEQAAVLLKSLIETDDDLTALMTTPDLRLLGSNCKRLVRLCKVTMGELDARLLLNPETLFNAALVTPLSTLVVVLRFAENELPGTFAALCGRFLEAGHKEEVIEMAMCATLDDLVAFLKFTEQSLTDLFAELKRGLGDSTHLDTLAEAAASAPLDQLVAFLKYTELHMPGLQAALKRKLSEPGHLEVLLNAAMRGPLGGVAAFWDYASNRATDLAGYLQTELSLPEALLVLADTAYREPLNHFAAFLCGTPFAEGILAAIDRAKWRRLRLRGGSEQPDYILPLAREFHRLGASELGEAPALSLIQEADPKRWHQPGVGLHHLATVLRLGRNAGAEEMRRFLKRVVAPAWLAKQYSEARTHTIASLLLGLWRDHGPEEKHYFYVPALKKRLDARLVCLGEDVPADFAATIELLGCLALFDVKAEATLLSLPNSRRLNAGARFSAPTGQADTVSYIQMKYWLGLRELAGLTLGGITISPAIGDQTLEAWRMTPGQTHKHRIFNEWMVQWLGRCAENNWSLIPDGVPITESLNRCETG